MFDQENRYVISNYQRKPTFSSFLPGIAGEKGVPAWVYYNNRGQGVCSFGAQDKDHSIMEFSPAHVSYQNNARTGFRTFVKINGKLTELLSGNVDMHIGMADLVLQQTYENLDIRVAYYGLPNQPIAGLVRMVTIENQGAEAVTLELLDGMSAVVCYGIELETLKLMTQLSKAWMQSEFQENGCTYFRVRASMADTACVTQVDGVNFAYAMDENGQVLKPVVQPQLVFGQDTGLETAEGFANTSLDHLQSQKQVTTNQFPCCFFMKEKVLQPGEKLQVYSLYGQGANSQKADGLICKISGPQWFHHSHEQAVALVDHLTNDVSSGTANPIFDGYCRQTYLDNLLRGGKPMFFEHSGKQVPFYLYSRKHGDPEREYNYFSVGNEYYAQGNGNFRDVNQNRRCDILFYPELGTANIRMFYELLQTDGYNPLVIQATTFRLEKEDMEKCVQLLPQAFHPQAKALLSQPFTPGQLAMAAQEWTPEHADTFVAACLVCATCDPNGSFGEGYWCDHWTYNLDLIDSYLSIYPENKQALLFGASDYRWFASQAAVLPRQKRYTPTENGLRQYKSIDTSLTQDSRGQWLVDAQGNLVRSTLMEKLVLLCLLKTATLDCEGMGVEMEGGKPGWYDALNGLPGLFGSSMAESCELLRLLDFTTGALEEYSGTMELYAEMAGLLTQVADAADISNPMERWNRMNAIREAYREETRRSLSGIRRQLPREEVACALKKLTSILETGIAKAESLGNGLIPTYFYYQAYNPDANGIPERFDTVLLPYFLEGPVRRLKTHLSQEAKQSLHKAVKASPLYDEQLHMYKVNASLDGVSYEVGRTKAFTPGWLENESIWLHMEYKYLLELLKSGMYQEFFEAFRDAGVPFMNPEVYGRNPLENVSFIASSALPDSQDHGRGFVARLSGSTAEFLQMWHLMFFGSHPFRYVDGQLTATFAPAIPPYLMPSHGILSTTFLADVKVTYCCPGKDALVPGTYTITSWHVTCKDGTSRDYQGESLPQEAALKLRERQISAIEVTIT